MLGSFSKLIKIAREKHVTPTPPAERPNIFSFHFISITTFITSTTFISRVILLITS